MKYVIQYRIPGVHELQVETFETFSDVQTRLAHPRSDWDGWYLYHIEEGYLFEINAWEWVDGYGRREVFRNGKIVVEKAILIYGNIQWVPDV